MLTKKDFLSYRICKRRAFLDLKSQNTRESLSVAELERIKQGIQVGELARQLRPGKLIDIPSFDLDRAIDATMAAINSDACVIYEGAFEHQGAVARPDALVRVSGGWELHEVKSSTSVKPDHISELAFQKYVVGRSGLEIVRTRLLHLNSDYRWMGGPHDLCQMFTEADVSDQVERVSASIPDSISQLLDLSTASDEPAAVPNTHCKSSQCPHRPHCFRSLPKHDVTLLPRVASSAVDAWHAEGKRDISSLDPEKLSSRHRLIQSVITNREPYIAPELGSHLERMKYPIAFVDFESFATAIPVTPGTSPYSQVPFQWSAHILDSLQGQPVHKSFLCREQADPRFAFSESLYDAVKDARSVVTYSSFENARIRALAEDGIAYGNLLAEIFSHSIDLMRIVEACVYMEEFCGQVSIKTVLPALVPQLSYQDLEIQDGRTAAAEYCRMLRPSTVKDEFDSIARSLEAYCERDTLAMVHIFQQLNRLSGGG